ncbi:protein arv1 homolog isoform X5 [Cucurbita pepo subsp. pepo]|uniref:protein arv1 homolog isoform X5 n=1 Tax=Cucurbita pepo subsp. pepo TaxID=3664 RepID=UPI000C9D56F7|nr:protein arv1 homolog isoform X5 [Cucurbita pepo subsp. pepo]XP_023527860.1 protein arv1 homolog isoform X5 [Cucurbita pepo subsp. pepo]
MGRDTNRNRCVQCGFGTNQLFLLYSPGNMHLVKCDNCKSVADEYIECEIMIVLIDLILLKRQAYTHLLYNLIDTDCLSRQDLAWKFGLSFLLLDAYRYMILRLSEKQSSMTFSSTIGICQKILMDICVGNIMFICALHILSRVFLRSSAGVHKYRYKDFFFAIIISSYFKIFLVCMMIWEFPSPVIFIIDLFVLSSNVIAIKVITESGVSRCVGTCLCAHGAKFLATKLFEK